VTTDPQEAVAAVSAAAVTPSPFAFEGLWCFKSSSAMPGCVFAHSLVLPVLLWSLLCFALAFLSFPFLPSFLPSYLPPSSTSVMATPAFVYWHVQKLP
jgi:hypothetical protein